MRWGGHTGAGFAVLLIRKKIHPELPPAIRNGGTQLLPSDCEVILTGAHLGYSCSDWPVRMPRVMVVFNVVEQWFDAARYGY